MEARVQHRCQQGHTFSQVSRTGSLLVSPSLQAPASPWLMVASPPPPASFLHGLPHHVCCCVHFSSYSNSCGCRAHPKSRRILFQDLNLHLPRPISKHQVPSRHDLGRGHSSVHSSILTASNRPPDLATQNLFC